jgi:hypothetical protein
MANATPFHYGRHKNFQKEPIPFNANLFVSASGDCVVTITKSPAAAGPPQTENVGIVISEIQIGIGALATAPTIQIADNIPTQTWGPFHLPVAVGYYSVVFDPPILFNAAAATSVIVTLHDGGNVLKDLYVIGYVDGTEMY